MQTEEYLARIDKASRRYSARLMNNTKWREVFLLIAQYEVEFALSFIWDDHRFSASFFHHDGCPESKLFDKHTADCFTGGPFYYKELFGIKIDKFRTKRDVLASTETNDSQGFDAFFEALSQLGGLPMKDETDHIILLGYQE